MATTDKEVNTGDAEFAAAFNEGEDQGAPAGGLDMEAEGGAESDLPNDGDAPAETAPAEAQAAPAEEEPVADPVDTSANGSDVSAATGESGDAPAIDREAELAKKEQSLKSWEGRLKKLQAELKDAGGPGADEGEVAAEALEEVAEDADEAGKTALAASASELADQVEEGTISADEAYRSLTEDFGEPFVKMIETIVRKVASEEGGKAALSKVGEVDAKVEEAIGHIKNEAQRAHFEKIAAAHPDFAEVNDDPAFQAWVAEDPARSELVAGGSASDLIALLSEFKSSGGDAGAVTGDEAAPAAADEPAAPAAETEADDGASSDELDAAEGVSASGGLSLPEEPAGSGDYEGAWAEFDDRK